MSVCVEVCSALQLYITYLPGTDIPIRTLFRREKEETSKEKARSFSFFGSITLLRANSYLKVIVYNFKISSKNQRTSNSNLDLPIILNILFLPYSITASNKV